MTFTPEQIQNWQAYESVRVSGDFNMFAPQAFQAAGLTRDEHLFCMANYDALKKAAHGQAT